MNSKAIKGYITMRRNQKHTLVKFAIEKGELVNFEVPKNVSSLLMGEHGLNGSIQFFGKSEIDRSIVGTSSDFQKGEIKGRSIQYNLKTICMIKDSSHCPVCELMKRFGIRSKIDKEYYELSRVAKKKVDIISAFLGDNDLVVLDNPFAILPDKYRQELISIIESRREEQTIVIINDSTNSLNYSQNIVATLEIVENIQRIAA